jgi:hypothetical protein
MGTFKIFNSDAGGLAGTLAEELAVVGEATGLVAAD